MAERPYRPTMVRILPDGLEVAWDDGHRSLLPHRLLRGHCGCAHCVDELTHQRRVSTEDVDPDVRVEDYLEVGNYALHLLFSDLHETGIYPFQLLRQLGTGSER